MLAYPKAYNFPLEMTCWEIMSRLEQRNFDVPGIAVTWDGELRLPQLLKVRGRDFSLEFLPESASLLRVGTPGKEFQFWGKSNEHFLTLCVYAYTDWERDRDWFLDDTLKYNGRQRGMPRYLKYRSQCNCSDLHGVSFGSAPELLVDYFRGNNTLPPQSTFHTHRDRWACLLMVFNGHDDTEYAPIEGQEPTMYRTEEIMGEMQQWLTTQVLSRI